MWQALRHTARERFTLGHLLGIAVTLAVLRFVLDFTIASLSVVALAFVVIEAFAILRETPGIDSRYVTAGVGVFVVLGSGVMIYAVAVGGESGPTWFPALTALAGVWFLLDAAADLRTGREPGSSEEKGSAETMLRMSHAHLVTSELEDGPKTVPELAEACDLTESRVREALDALERSGAVEPREEGYVLNERNLGGVAFVRNLVVRGVRRILRPFRAFV